MLDVRADFPFLARQRNGKPIIYLDSAATTQKPSAVIAAVSDRYAYGMANVHRAGSFLAEEVTAAYEDVRETVAQHIGAAAEQIVFVNNATHGINVVCAGLARQGLPLRIVTSTLEHHSNFLPWSRHHTELAPWDDRGYLELDQLERLLAPGADLLAVTAGSNFLGAIQPIREIVELSHKHQVPVLIDASQAIAHLPVDVGDVGCDFLVFSGHKTYGPSGTGVVYVSGDRLNELEPSFLGGGIVAEVHAGGFALNSGPARHEAGTPNIEGIVGLGAAIDYLVQFDPEEITLHGQRLRQRLWEGLQSIPRVRTFGPGGSDPALPVLSFVVDGVDSAAVTKTLSERANIVVRSGFHCAQPAHDRLRVGPTVRASFALYSCDDDINRLIEAITAIARVAA